VALGFVLQGYQEFDRECRQRRRLGRVGKYSLQREVGLLRLPALPQLPLEALFDGLIPGSLDRSHAAGYRIICGLLAFTADCKTVVLRGGAG
jgi:hypothetical protein